MLLPGWWRVPTLSINLEHRERKPLVLSWGAGACWHSPPSDCGLETLSFRLSPSFLFSDLLYPLLGFPGGASGKEREGSHSAVSDSLRPHGL